jgi:putative nucleotidyltransferase with HDIG domain
VQSYAVGLAKRLGVTDDKLLKAIEAAALLHDMGKLAVPEYILNKPGKLSAVEFEKMKLHATIGADILSAIEFPYPVVPIVRHHHESWNGSGYPEGIRGTDIPIGARILSVVDCFDALTSDRPYRPALSDEAALQILADRRGSMYDPLVVDTFARVYKEIAPESLPVGPHRAALHEMTAAIKAAAMTMAAPPEIQPSTIDLRPDGIKALRASGESVTAYARRLVPCDLSIFYLNDSRTNELETSEVDGDAGFAVRDRRIPLGQRLSGWVAVNGQTILNSDAALDLDDVARAAGLLTCLSVPVSSRDRLIGVLTLYSAKADRFTQCDVDQIEIIATEIADNVHPNRPKEIAQMQS